MAPLLLQAQVSIYSGTGINDTYTLSCGLQPNDKLTLLNTFCIYSQILVLPNYISRAGNDSVNVRTIHVELDYARASGCELISISYGVSNQNVALSIFGNILGVEHTAAGTSRITFKVDAWLTFGHMLFNKQMLITKQPPQSPFATSDNSYLFKNHPLPTNTKFSGTIAEVDTLNQSLCFCLMLTTDLQGKGDGEGVGYHVMGGIPFWGFYKTYSFDAAGLQALTSDLYTFVNISGGYFSESQINLFNNVCKILIMPTQLAVESTAPYQQKGYFELKYKAKYQSETSPDFLGVVLYCGSSGDHVELDTTALTWVGDGSGNYTASFDYEVKAGGGLNPKTSISIYRQSAADGTYVNDVSRVLYTLDYPEIPIIEILTEKNSWLGDLRGFAKIGEEALSTAGFSSLEGKVGFAVGGGIAAGINSGIDLAQKMFGYNGGGVIHTGTQNALFSFYNGGFSIGVLERTLNPGNQTNFQKFVEENGETCYEFKGLHDSGPTQIAGNIRSNIGCASSFIDEIQNKLMAGFFQLKDLVKYP